MDRLAANFPSQAMAAVLGGFSSGRDVAVFFEAAIANMRLRSTMVSLCRGILVQRYVELAAQIDVVPLQPEIKDVLDVVREDIRLSNDYDETSNSNSIAIMMRRFSEWCALLEYFERQWHLSRQHPSVPLQWIVWSGICEIPYGQINAVLISSNWTAGALSYWRNRELASGWSMAHSRNADLVVIDFLPYYGRVLARNEDGRRRFVLENRDLASHAVDNNDELVLARSALVSFGEAYEEDITMALVAHSKTKSLAGMKCYWDIEEGEEGDWEDAIAALGGHAMRILTTTTASAEGQSLELCLKEVYTDLERDIKE